MKTEDIYGPVCGCRECAAAGVAEERTRRDPDTGRMLHGFALKRGLDAFKQFQMRARQAVGSKGPRGTMSKLVKR